jgi:hypothetical protein
MPTFVVTDLGPLTHDGVTSTEGDHVVIQDASAAHLLEIGVITPAQEPNSKAKSTAKDVG